MDLGALSVRSLGALDARCIVLVEVRKQLSEKVCEHAPYPAHLRVVLLQLRRAHPLRLRPILVVSGAKGGGKLEA